MTRTILSLDGIWDFFPDFQQRLTFDTLESAGQPRQIQVPAPWQTQFDDLRAYSGVAWYRTQFTLPEPVPAQLSTYIHFGAVDYLASVWLNGVLLGTHEGGYLPFEFALDAAVRPGAPNQLIVQVIDPSDDRRQFPAFPFAEIPHGKQSWYGQSSGIWQSVTLELRPPFHLASLHLTPDVPNAQVLGVARFSQAAPDGASLRLNLRDPRGQPGQQTLLIEAGAGRLAFALPIAEPLLWDTHNPHLYQVEAILSSASQTNASSADTPTPPPDSLVETFGMRSIATTPEGYLLLNNRVLYLRGALDQDYYPHSGYTAFSDQELDAQFARARHMGLNCLRTHIKIADPRYYAAADRAGILIWAELPNWENLSSAARQRARDTLAGMVERDWNHPAIIIWTIINEGWGVDLAVNADHRAWLAETYTFLKELDPYRLVVGNSPCYTNFHVVTDIEDFHNYYAIPDHYRKWRNWVQVFASRPPWTFALTYDSYDTWCEFLRDPWNPSPRSAAPEVRRRGNEPMVVSEFGNWGLPDMKALYQCYGGEPWWFETGIEWGDGVAYPHGVEQRFYAFHLDVVFPTLADLTAASQRMQFTALKYQIEQMRRHQSIVGYIITEFTDVHWECNGLLDMCRNPKAFYDVIGNVNSADAIVPDWERVVFWEGERCEVRLAVSHFSASERQGCRLVWRLDQWPEIGGSFNALTFQPGQVVSPGTVVFELPRVEQSSRVRLELALYDAAGQQITYNHHELYVFPRHLGVAARSAAAPRLYAQNGLRELLQGLGYQLVDSLAHADIAVVETMTDSLRWHLQNGGTILWLANSSEAKQTYLGSLNIAQRQGRSWQGDWASSMSWLRHGPMFQDIPTGGVVDFAFADLTPDYVIVGLRAHDFAANVHAGLFVGWLHHTVALIAEQHYGSGRLLTCTFQLREHLLANPVAQIMFSDLLDHLQHDAHT